MRYMKTASPTLLPLLRSRSQGDILAAIMLDPDRERSLTEIAEETGTSVSTVQREVARLEQGGLVTTTRRGNTRLVRAVTDSVIYKPLADLLAVTFGPAAVLRTALADIPGIERAFIYGSWAARYARRSGPVPKDIDLLVVGDPDRHVLADAVAEAEGVLRREVNVRRVSAHAWAEDQGSFKQTVLARPVVDLIGGHSG
jgi:DNA-binding transcriptional ArsR family regulator